MTPSSGRPREFDPAKRSELINHVTQGASVAQAAKIVGVSLRTVQRQAKTNDEFHHELALAEHDAPVDPERQMNRAARAHWRAAAWMLERSDPDRFGKRPAKSCSHEKLRDMITYLIELALEAVPREHHEAVYRHMRPAADAACAMLLPDHQESQRWTRALVTRPMRLSENVRNELFLSDLASPGQCGFYSPQASPSGGSQPRDSSECDDDDRYSDGDDDRYDEGDDDFEAAMKAKERALRDRDDEQAIYADMERRRVRRLMVTAFATSLAKHSKIAADRSAAAAAAATSEMSDSTSTEPSSDHGAAPPDIAPPDGGIMSPKMHFSDSRRQNAMQ